LILIFLIISSRDFYQDLLLILSFANIDVMVPGFFPILLNLGPNSGSCHRGNARDSQPLIHLSMCFHPANNGTDKLFLREDERLKASWPLVAM